MSSLHHMIFRPLPTLNDRITGIGSMREQWGYYTPRNVGTPEYIANETVTETARHGSDMNRLRDAELISIDTVAAELGITADEYRALATARRAILITAENDTIQLVPTWAILRPQGATPSVNTLVVDIAREFASYRADQSALAFCDFMQRTQVVLPLQDMAEHLRDNGAVKQAFAIIAGKSDFRDLDKMLIGYSLRDAVTMAKNGAADESIYQNILHQAQATLNPSQRGQVTRLTA